MLGSLSRLLTGREEARRDDAPGLSTSLADEGVTDLLQEAFVRSTLALESRARRAARRPAQ